MNPATNFANAFAAQLDAVSAVSVVASKEPLSQSIAELKQWVTVYGDTVKDLCEGFGPEGLKIPNPLAHFILKGAAAQVNSAADDVHSRLVQQVVSMASGEDAPQADVAETVFDYLTSGVVGSLQAKKREIEVQTLSNASNWVVTSAALLESLGHQTINDSYAAALAAARVKAEEAKTTVGDRLSQGADRVVQGAQTAKDLAEIAGVLISGLAGNFGAGLFRRRKPSAPTTTDNGPASPGPDNPCLFPDANGDLSANPNGSTPVAEDKGPPSPGPDNPCWFPGPNGERPDFLDKDKGDVKPFPGSIEGAPKTDLDALFGMPQTQPDPAPLPNGAEDTGVAPGPVGYQGSGIHDPNPAELPKRQGEESKPARKPRAPRKPRADGKPRTPRKPKGDNTTGGPGRNCWTPGYGVDPDKK